MSYTPINWQTGDTITAEKLNKMDRGWGYVTMPIFSETVTTAIGDIDIPEAYFDFSARIDHDEIIVNFNGTDYTCLYNYDSSSDATYYGGLGEYDMDSGEFTTDFTDYPFLIRVDSGYDIQLFTENPGTYTVAVGVSRIEVSDEFMQAVLSCLESSEPV